MSKNKVLEKTNDYVIIELTQGKQTIIDAEDYDKIKNTKWHAFRGYKHLFYCISNKRQLLHRFILNVNQKWKVVDHINHNTLDNRKENLQILSANQHSSIHSKIFSNLPCIKRKFAKERNKWNKSQEGKAFIQKLGRKNGSKYLIAYKWVG